MPKRAYISALVILAAIFVALAPPSLTIVVLAGFLSMWFLVRNLEFGLLVLIFFFPYLGLVVDFGQFEIFREAQYIKNINAPFVDLFGLLLFGAWIIYLVINPKSEIRNPKQIQNQKIKNSSFVIRVLSVFPHWKFYLLFWLSGLVSLLRVPVIHFNVSLKYFARPFTFFYLVFFIAPVSILTSVRHPERSEGSRGVHEKRDSSVAGLRMTVLEKALLVFFWTGLLSAFNGFLGLVFGAHDAFPRAMPFGFLGINPLGPNHNLLAETLIATAPAGLILGLSPGSKKGLALYRYGMFFQWAVALLTFARTAWIAIAVQVIVYVWLTQRGRVRTFLRRSAPVLILLVILATMLLATTFSETVRGSTLSRLDMARIAFFYFERTPILGQGVGTFLPTLWQTKAFLLEYGDPLEAHGIIFKLMFEQGLFGIVTFGIFVGAILISLYRPYKTYRTDKTYSIALVTALLIATGTLTYQLFNTTYYTSKLWVPLAIAVAIAQASKSGKSSESSKASY